MSNPNTNQTTDAATDHISTARRMPELVHDVAGWLRKHGVIKVHARYEGKDVVIIFMGTDEQHLPKPTAIEAARSITNALRSILESRYPDATKSGGASGHFEWDLADGTLQHEHVVTVTYHGI
jgi:hypothetical protein